MTDTDRAKFSNNFLPSFSLLRYQISLLQLEDSTLVDEYGMIRTQMGNMIDQKMVTVA
jgi:hypothetical protein